MLLLLGDTTRPRIFDVAAVAFELLLPMVDEFVAELPLLSIFAFFLRLLLISRERECLLVC